MDSAASHPPAEAGEAPEASKDKGVGWEGLRSVSVLAHSVHRHLGMARRGLVERHRMEAAVMRVAFSGGVGATDTPWRGVDKVKLQHRSVWEVHFLLSRHGLEVR